MKALRHHLLRMLAALLLLAGGWTIYAATTTLLRSAAVRQPPFAGLPDFVSLARRFDPSLVHISTLHAEGAPAADAAHDGAGAQPVPLRRAGLGSGVILHRDGYILTNDHVVAHAERVFVKLADRRELLAAVVGRDARSDLALIKVAAPGALAAAPLGDSTSLQTGEWVIALGSPYGLERTLTAGIVSAAARRLGGSGYYDYIQTDVSINPGNSGGPLLNLRGLVVGINTAILSRNGNNTGINFAIPINLIKDLLPELFSKGRVSRGWLGMSIRTMGQQAARLLRLDKGGALVVGVAPDGPAARAGIRPGDVVVAYDGRTVSDAGELPGLVARTAVGRQVALYISRNRILYRAVLAVRELEEAEAPVTRGARSQAGSETLAPNGGELQS